MYCRYLKLFKQKRSHYISWNILFLWGFGLWIALCTSNMYNSIIIEQDLGITYNTSIKAKNIEDIVNITKTNYNFCNMILILKIMLQYIYIFVSISFILFFIYSHGYLKKVINKWKNMMCSSSIIPYFESFLKSRKKNVFNKNDSAMLEFRRKFMTNSEINQNTFYFQTNLSYDGEEDKLNLEKNKNILDKDINIVQNEIIFNTYTLLLFNNCELNQYFNNQQLKSYLSMKHFICQDSQFIKSNLKNSNNYKRNDNSLSKKVIQRGIVSSSPEFQNFLANLKKSQFFYPCLLEVSTSYMIHIKSIHK
ncbi:uncharacterized protein LOC133667005 [Apis cerana]|uniref:uncharacterized protein LOC133667005 n=1 Tax=Apis cerana TaxID=7461 RepID=UPI002B22361D|nr:uncharacterized protein LOC133667005 [Apis cerana]